VTETTHVAATHILDRDEAADLETHGLTALESRSILSTRVDATSYEDAAERIAYWAVQGESRYVCVANVNNVMEAKADPRYRAVMNAADLVTPDGVPLVWGLRLLGVRHAARVYGPNLALVVCARGAALGIPIGFHGGTLEAVAGMTQELTRRFPSLQVTYCHSPPFRKVSPEENSATVREITHSGARILFVGLGAPSQERWMAQHRGEINAVMIGVGAAFDFISGRKRQAPAFMQAVGMEWLFRLATEPRRLWRRYLYRNPAFVALFTAQLVRGRVRGDSGHTRGSAIERGRKP
jgi:N-acetylglucosaminyldiphosphoundecaprenol N-acetyl-beta-D-mannosaminyltransferase